MEKDNHPIAPQIQDKEFVAFLQKTLYYTDK
jgi:hypothetical protein